MMRFISLCLCAGIACAGDAHLPPSGREAAPTKHPSPVREASRRGPALTEAVAFRLAPQRKAERSAVIVLKPARVFDGAKMHNGWIVVVRGDKIAAAGPPD